MLDDLRDTFVECLPSDDNCVDIHDLESGSSGFMLLTLVDMKHDIEKMGNLYILLVGIESDNDISNWTFSGSLPDEILASYHVTRLYDRRIPANEAYLIAFDYMPQKPTDITTKLVTDKLTGKNTCTKFVRN